MRIESQSRGSKYQAERPPSCTKLHRRRGKSLLQSAQPASEMQGSTFHGALMRLESAEVLSSTIVRLILAAALGGIIGLEREFSHKPAGLRTNMFICFGSAMFTILSTELAGEYGGDHTRIAAQIIPGIGFIGAGSILRDRGSVTGLTTAATLFVVASIGMAVGGGLYLPAVFATLVIFLVLEVLGYLETRLGFKAIMAQFEVAGENVEQLLAAANRALEAGSKA